MLGGGGGGGKAKGGLGFQGLGFRVEGLDVPMPHELLLWIFGCSGSVEAKLWFIQVGTASQNGRQHVCESQRISVIIWYWIEGSEFRVAMLYIVYTWALGYGWVYGNHFRP